jgi:hypothetical protein
MTQGGTLIAGASSSLGNGAASNTVSFNNATLLTSGPIVGVNRPISILGGGGTINTNGFDSTFGAATGTASGALTKTGSGTLTLTSVRISGTTATLNVSGGKLLLAPNGQAAGVSAVNATVVNTAAAAQLDLSNNHLIDKTTGVGVLQASMYTGLTGLIARGRGTSPTWSGAGIITSQTDAIGSDHTSIGIATASQVEGIGATNSSVWAGLTVVGTDALIMYTYGGDATLDGKINIDDYTRIDNGTSTAVAGWYNGDFNYDGKINIDDYTIIDANIGNQSGQFFVAGGIDDGGGGDLAGVSAVPEPGSAGVVILSAMLLGLRRLRRAVAPKAHG